MFQKTAVEVGLPRNAAPPYYQVKPSLAQMKKCFITQKTKNRGEIGNLTVQNILKNSGTPTIRQSLQGQRPYMTAYICVDSKFAYKRERFNAV